LQVMGEVRSTYPDDPTLIGIIEDSEGICRRLSSGEALPTPTLSPEMQGTTSP
jgi:hypothetical protein